MTYFDEDARKILEAIGIDHYELKEQIIKFVGENYSPNGVFIEEELADWAREYACETLDPEEVFPEEGLEDWALNNGFKRVEDKQ
jgi:hypothetical protein